MRGAFGFSVGGTLSAASSMPVYSTYFDTPLGICGVAWGERRIAHTRAARLPEHDLRMTFFRHPSGSSLAFMAELPRDAAAM